MNCRDCFFLFASSLWNWKSGSFFSLYSRATLAGLHMVGFRVLLLDSLISHLFYCRELQLPNAKHIFPLLEQIRYSVSMTFSQQVTAKVYCISICKWLLHLWDCWNYANNYTVQIIIINFSYSRVSVCKPRLCKMVGSSKSAYLIWSISTWLWDVLKAPYAKAIKLIFNFSCHWERNPSLSNKWSLLFMSFP